MITNRLTDESGNVLFDESTKPLGDESYTGVATLTGVSSSATVSSPAASLLKDSIISGQTGSINIVGNDATLTRVLTLFGDSESINILGNAANLIFRRAPSQISTLTVNVEQYSRTVPIQGYIEPTVAIPQEHRQVYIDYKPSSRNV